MENYEYLSEGATPQVNIPFFTGWGFFLDLFGQQTMRGPLRLQTGEVWAPSLTFSGDNRTGIFSPLPQSIGYAIFGFLRFLVSDAGTTFYNVSGFGGTIAADLITENQTYQLPDQSGTLALESSFLKINAEAFSVQAGQPVKLSGATDCALAQADDYTNRAVGLAKVTTASGSTVTVLTVGVVELSDWTNVIGSTSLTTGDEYFLNPGAAGAITNIPPDTVGLVLQYLGRAVTAQKLLIELERPYQL